MYRTLTNHMLLQGIRQKDRDAFDALYHRLAEPLLDMAMLKTGDRAGAQDIVQELFIWLWEKAPDISLSDDNDSSVRAYLFGALRNKILNYHAALVRQGKAAGELLRLAPVAAETDPQKQVEWRELERAIEKEVEALPAEMKKIYQLSNRSAMSIQEIANQLLLSEQTVKNQLGLASRRIRSSLYKFRTWLF